MLELLSVDKAYQRRGAGLALVEWGTKKADELGIEVSIFYPPETCYLLNVWSLMQVFIVNRRVYAGRPTNIRKGGTAY